MKKYTELCSQVNRFVENRLDFMIAISRLAAELFRIVNDMSRTCVPLSTC